MHNRDASDETRISAALRWALEEEHDSARAAADWLTRDFCPSYSTAFDLLSDPDASLEHLIAAKNAFKTMRVVGETALDRQLGARLYAATIAAALVLHNSRISTQSSHTIRRALAVLVHDPEIPEPMRATAELAIHMLNVDSQGRSDA